MENTRKGRPTKPETTELVAALGDRQRAMAQRTASKINEILSTHVRRGDVARAYVGSADLAREMLSRQLPARIRARLGWGDADMAVIQTLIDEALDELVVTAEDRALAARPPLPPEPRAVVARVSSYAAARAQTARLHARLIDLKQRVVHETHRERIS